MYWTVSLHSIDLMVVEKLMFDLGVETLDIEELMLVFEEIEETCIEFYENYCIIKRQHE